MLNIPTFHQVQVVDFGRAHKARAYGPRDPHHPTLPTKQTHPLINTALIPPSFLFSSPFLFSLSYIIFSASPSSPPLNLSPPAGMSNNTTFPTPHYPPYDYSTPDLSRYENQIELSDLEVDTSYGSTDSVLDTYHSGQDPYRPNTSSGSTGWEPTTPRIPGVTSPSSHEVMGGVPDAVPATHLAYPVGPTLPYHLLVFHATP